MMLTDLKALKAAVGVSIAAWVIFGNLLSVYNQVIKQNNPWLSLRRLSRSFYGMSLAHIGLGVTIIGITISSLYSSEIHKAMTPGNSVELGGYTFYLVRMSEADGPNYRSYKAEMQILKNGKQVTLLHPEKRVYHVRNDMPMTEAGIDAGITRDLYVSMGELLENGSWSIRMYHKPFVRWIWLGAIFMALGGVLVITDKRYRTVLQPRINSPEDEIPAQVTAASKVG
jgi:cytochrome c-type biogenesis protein CcmF